MREGTWKKVKIVFMINFLLNGNLILLAKVLINLNLPPAAAAPHPQ